MAVAMPADPQFEIYLVTAPGLEAALTDEARVKGFRDAKALHGGVRIRGGWTDVWRANLELRGAARVLARIGSFRAMHLAQLDKRARKFPWQDFFRKDVPVRVEASCKGSRIYHAGAAAQRIGAALADTLGVTLSDEAEVCLKARIEDDLCTLSIDTSGETLHKRGHKEAVGKAPMRENMAALFLRQCGFNGQEPVFDPMCGSGTFVIEAAEIAAGLLPGRSRHFAFEQLKTFKGAERSRLLKAAPVHEPAHMFYGSDRDAGAVTMSRANAERAGVSDFTEFRQQPVSAIRPPPGPAGLVIVNPPYGGRIGDKKPLLALYAALGRTLLEHFHGWRVGLITSSAMLARATGLPFAPPSPAVSHGGIKVQLFQAPALPWRDPVRDIVE